MAFYTEQNQTKFSVEKPLFEQMGEIPGPEHPEAEEPRVPLLKQKKFVISLIAVITVVILIVLFVVNAYISRSKLVQDQEPPESSTQQEPQQAGPLLQRITAAQNELREADPRKQDLVYPTMDYNISLDEKR